MSFHEAVKNLADHAGMQVPNTERSREEKEEEKKKMLLLEIQKEAGNYFYLLLRSDRGKRAHDYFLSRGLSEETIRSFALGYSDQYKDDLYRYLKKKGFKDEQLMESGLCSFNERSGGQDKFWNRAMFPILNMSNKVIGFGGRVMGEGEPKYLNSPDTLIFEKGKNLYAMNRARSTKRPYFLLCEGYMDVISLHQAGFDNAVAALGTAFTIQQAMLFKRLKKSVYLTFDSDPPGVKAALRAIPMLRSAGVSCKVLNLSPYKDPDELIKAEGAEAFQKKIDEAENSFFFEVRQDSLQFDLNDPEQKTAFFDACASRILKFKDELERENYIEAVADKYHVGTDLFRNRVAKLGREDGIVRKRVTERADSDPEMKRKERSSEAAMLSILAEKPELYKKVREILTPEDFVAEPYNRVAKMLFEQLEAGNPDPAAILDSFGEEDRSKVVGIFHAKPRGLDEEEGLEEQVVREMSIKIKENSIQVRTAQADGKDLELLQKLMKEKIRIDELKGQM
jgi:DNA primase